MSSRPLAGFNCDGATGLRRPTRGASPGRLRSAGIMVFALADDRISGITGFARYPELYAVFDLPATLA